MAPTETIIDQARKLVAVLSVYVDFMPRNKKFTFGDRIITHALAMTENLVEAYYGPRNVKLDKINNANIKLELIRQILRILFEMQNHNVKKHAYLNREIDNLGVNLGGWRKQLRCGET